MKITREKFNAYRRVQFSGVTNMFVISKVKKISGLTEEECKHIMRNYGDLKKKYGEWEGAK